MLDLRSLTGGRGTFTAVHHHDAVVPTHLVERVKSGIVADGARAHH